MKLRCLESYVSKHGNHQKGAVVEVPESIGAWLLRDSPGSWESVEDAQPKAAARRSEETATGLAAPDRRMRGGGKR